MKIILENEKEIYIEVRKEELPLSFSSNGKTLCVRLDQSETASPISPLKNRLKEAKRMSETMPNFEQFEEDCHRCSVEDFTCHYLGKALTLTYQKEGTDSVHRLVKNCPFCGHENKYKNWERPN